VYIYLDPRKSGNFDYQIGDEIFHFDFEPFYVGKGKGRRMFPHLNEARRSKKRSHKLSKIKSILNINDIPIILKIQQNLTNCESVILENRMIKTIGNIFETNGPLVNILQTKGASDNRRGIPSWNKGLTKDSHPSMKIISDKMAGKKKNYKTWNTGLTKETHPSICETSRKTKGKKRLFTTCKGKKTLNPKYQDESSIFIHYEIDKSDFFNLYDAGKCFAEIGRTMRIPSGKNL
jgi:hypothetical protein